MTKNEKTLHNAHVIYDEAVEKLRKNWKVYTDEGWEIEYRKLSRVYNQAVKEFNQTLV
jgi:DNA polymerase IIIc chi subunit